MLSVKNITGHKIDQHVWYTADVEWLLYGSAVSDDGEDALSVACVWRMKLLFSTDEKDEGPVQPHEHTPRSAAALGPP
ncbi:hypothetical protein ABZ352_37555 [Streptomyces griseofuscus]|uniref:hypothetical protein n=1 Tax=Streptomyces griseofuscus TaxID=146922 RepID=UPI0033CB7DC6